MMITTAWLHALLLSLLLLLLVQPAGRLAVTSLVPAAAASCDDELAAAAGCGDVPAAAAGCNDELAAAAVPLGWEMAYGALRRTCTPHTPSLLRPTVPAVCLQS